MDENVSQFWKQFAAFIAGAALVMGFTVFAGVMQPPWCSVPTVYDYCVAGKTIFTDQNKDSRLHNIYFSKGTTFYGQEMFAQGKSEGFKDGNAFGFSIGVKQVKFVNSLFVFERLAWIANDFKRTAEILREKNVCGE